MSNRIKTNIHHIIPKSKGWTNYKDNLITLNTEYHKSFHRVFWNKKPREQILQILLNINDTALTKEFKEDIFKILSESDDLYYYNKLCIK